MISRALLERIRAIAAADPAREVCGLLRGRDGVVEVIDPAANVAADPTSRFEIDPHVLIAAARDSRRGGLQVIGCYHSHPTGLARPSTCDRELAEPGSVWLILAVDGVTVWQRGTTEFQQLNLVVH